jgi:transcription initiation factor TFIIF subunit beta
MMEVAANGSVTVPKSYTLNMSNDIIPMYIFSETSEGEISIDGKVEHKFDMKPHSQNIDDYGGYVEKGQTNLISEQDKCRL